MCPPDTLRGVRWRFLAVGPVKTLRIFAASLGFKSPLSHFLRADVSIAHGPFETSWASRGAVRSSRTALARYRPVRGVDRRAQRYPSTRARSGTSASAMSRSSNSPSPEPSPRSAPYRTDSTSATAAGGTCSTSARRTRPDSSPTVPCAHGTTAHTGRCSRQRHPDAERAPTRSPSRGCSRSLPSHCLSPAPQHARTSKTTLRPPRSHLDQDEIHAITVTVSQP